eukprot:415453-Prorocentrum_minimum.AAC.1
MRPRRSIQLLRGAHLVSRRAKARWRGRSSCSLVALAPALTPCGPGGPHLRTFSQRHIWTLSVGTHLGGAPGTPSSAAGAHEGLLGLETTRTL